MSVRTLVRPKAQAALTTIFTDKGSLATGGLFFWAIAKFRFEYQPEIILAGIEDGISTQGEDGMTAQYLVITIAAGETFMDWYDSRDTAMAMAREQAEAGCKAVVAHMPHVFEAMPSEDENAGIYHPVTMTPHVQTVRVA